MKPIAFLLAIGVLLCQSVAAGELSRKQWSELFAPAMSTEMCADGSYFRECLALQAPQCEQAVKSSTSACLATHEKQLPVVFRSKQESTDAGKLIGGCVGKTVDARFAAQRTMSLKCVKSIGR
jgi:hypothetical protein